MSEKGLSSFKHISHYCYYIPFSLVSLLTVQQKLAHFYLSGLNLFIST